MSTQNGNRAISKTSPREDAEKANEQIDGSGHSPGATDPSTGGDPARRLSTAVTTRHQGSALRPFASAVHQMPLRRST